jgi:hypothetical protein
MTYLNLIHQKLVIKEEEVEVTVGRRISLGKEGYLGSFISVLILETFLDQE